MFSIVLVHESGEYVKGYCEQDFNNCMYSIDLKTVLQPGKYTLVVDAIWNETTKKDELYRNIVVDIYCPEELRIARVNTDSGFRMLSKSLGNLAQKSQTKKFYLSNDEEYGQNVYKVSDLRKLTGCRFGICYTRNDSSYPLKEKLTVNLKGAEILWPSPGPAFDLDIAAGSDHLVIFKQTENQASYGYTPQTLPREKSEEELR